MAARLTPDQKDRINRALLGQRYGVDTAQALVDVLEEALGGGRQQVGPAVALRVTAGNPKRH